MANTTTLKLKQYAAVAAVALLVVALEMFGQAIPEWIRAGIYSAASGAVGKAFGTPIKQVLIAALESLAKRRPDEAVSVAVSALQSLPPATAESATARMFASLPPSVRERASISPPPNVVGQVPQAPLIHFVHDDDADPVADAGPVPAPIDPTGQPIIVRTTPPAAAAANTNDTPATSPSAPRGGTITDDDAVTHPNRPSRMR